jgi:hypothetical protein
MIDGNAKARYLMRSGIFVLALVLCLSAAAGAASDPRGPQISVAEPLHDFGAVTAGAVLVHVFEIRNTGDGVLEIRKVAPS